MPHKSKQNPFLGSDQSPPVLAQPYLVYSDPERGTVLQGTAPRPRHSSSKHDAIFLCVNPSYVIFLKKEVRKTYLCSSPFVFSRDHPRFFDKNQHCALIYLLSYEEVHTPLNQFLIRGWYQLRDTRSPMRTEVYTMQRDMNTAQRILRKD